MTSPRFRMARRRMWGCFALGTLVLPASTASAQVFFDTPFVLSPVERPEDVAVLDLDADGDLDVVTTGGESQCRRRSGPRNRFLCLPERV